MGRLILLAMLAVIGLMIVSWTLGELLRQRKGEATKTRRARRN